MALIPRKEISHTECVTGANLFREVVKIPEQAQCMPHLDASLEAAEEQAVSEVSDQNASELEPAFS